jgi:hypothetical protein
MTYNFDPDRWYENEFFVIRSKYKAGQMTRQEYHKTVEELERKHEMMWERLNGSYQLPRQAGKKPE